MSILSAFVREQKRYSKLELTKIFHLSDIEANAFLEKLKAFGILKVVRNEDEQKYLSDLIDENFEISDYSSDIDNFLYVFTYVGIIACNNRVIKCYPKYIFSNESPVQEMKQILKVISKCSEKEQIVAMYNGNNEATSFNMFAVVLYLLNDYYESGLYTNTEDIIEITGEGEIIWDKTINESFMFMQKNKPYYIDLYTEQTVDDDFDFLKRVHKCILTSCSKKLEESDLLELFDMEPINLSEDSLDDISDIEYIKHHILSELNIQFNTRKQLLLKTLYAYLENSNVAEYDYGVSLYGTNSFNLIWEKVCASVLGNKLQTPLSKLSLPVSLSSEYNPAHKLIEVIDKPCWTPNDDDAISKHAQETLIPDLISVGLIQEKYRFIIFDAKYYNIQLGSDKPLRSCPGIGDITKQYLYQLAYKTFIEKHNISIVENCFLMPTENCDYIKKGTVRLDILSSLGLSAIQVWQLPVNDMYSKYLNNIVDDIAWLA